MRGSVQKRGNSWSIVFDLPPAPKTGERRQQWRAVPGSKKNAERELREVLHSVEGGTYIKPTRLTLEQWLEQWLGSYVRVNTSPRTAEGYEMIIYRHILPALGAIPLAQLQPLHLQNYYAQKLQQGRVDGRGALSRQTVLHHHRLLHEALDHAVKLGILVRNPAEAVVLSRPERRVEAALRHEDALELLKVIEGSRYHALFAVAFFTGLRRSEVLGLQWNDIELDFAFLTVVRSLHRLHNKQFVIRPTKSHRSSRPVDLPPSLALLLRQYKTEQQAKRVLDGKPLAGDDFVFARSDGSPLDPDVVSHAFTKLARKAGLPHIHLHSLRHAHATFLIREGLSLKMVAERLGHADVSTTLNLYTHVLPGDQAEAARRFDQLFKNR